ncbi:hypothetical protein VB773_03345 [Haloarculaceae archaeon H-GB2-1]|nr:hypothetical protein [Haloarculaceae archaeon H-GB1-1]MEA5406711.1 hypothetical protein [Haloarculaceae archaeon H-GB2-1]
MTDTLLVALTTAALLGVTHAVEPDHVAGISSLTSRSGDPRLSALVGACFSLGHVALVVVWLGVGYLLLGRTEFPAVLDAVGTTGVAILLGLFGAMLAVGGLQTVIRDGTHEHDGGEVHSHPHLSLPLPGFDAADHDHTTESYLKTGLVGALFTLSPPLSMIAFASTLLPNYGGGAIALAVVAYAVGITVTMSLLGAGVGTVFGLTSGRSARVHGGLQALAGVAVAGLGVSLAVGAVPSLF